MKLNNEQQEISKRIANQAMSQLEDSVTPTQAFETLDGSIFTAELAADCYSLLCYCQDNLDRKDVNAAFVEALNIRFEDY